MKPFVIIILLQLPYVPTNDVKTPTHKAVEISAQEFDTSVECQAKAKWYNDNMKGAGVKHPDATGVFNGAYCFVRKVK